MEPACNGRRHGHTKHYFSDHTSSRAGFALRIASPLRRLDGGRALVIECNRKKGMGNTLVQGGTKRKAARVSGFRTRMETVGGRKVIAARRAKGRHCLVPASAPNAWNKMKR